MGISIGLTRLFFVLQDQGYLNPEVLTAPADLLVLPMTGDLTAAISFATACRAAGIRTQLYTEAKKFKAKMNYADKTPASSPCLPSWGRMRSAPVPSP